MELVRQAYRVREFGGYALNFAARLEACVPHTILRIIHSSTISRHVFFAAAAGIDLDQPDIFLDQIKTRAPDVLADLVPLDPLAQVARALILMKPRTTLAVLYGSCPDGLLGLFERLGSQPLDRPASYRLAFDLFSDPSHRHRARVLGQLPGDIRPDHLTIVADLDDALVHRAVLERARPDETRALNNFASMIVDLCDATPSLIRESLDRLPLETRGVRIGEWAEGWMARQARLPVPPPIPDDDPDLRVRLGAEQVGLARRFRNCAAHRLSFSFLAERILIEWIRPGEEAVLELSLLHSGGEYRWSCEQVLAPRNRRVKPAVAVAIRQRLDDLGILYAASGEQLGLNALLQHWPAAPFPDFRAVDDDADIDRLLAGLEDAVGDRVAA